MNAPEQFTNIDEALEHAHSARELLLRDRKLNTLPDKIAQLTHLEVLDISVNPLHTLPKWLFELKTLRVLRMDCTGLDKIPAELGSLSALEELSVGGFDKFTQLPPTITSLHHLRKLDLTDASHLSALPDLSALESLQELFLTRTRKLANLPEALTRLPSLHTLFMDGVPRSVLPDKPGSLVSLRKCRLTETQVTELPSWIGSLDKLESLYLEDNEELSVLPEELGDLRSLRELYIGLAMPIPLPASLGKLANLEKLCLVSCNLTDIPEWVFGLTNLKILYVALNPITRVLPGISKLKHLQTLDLGYNPEVFAQRAEIQGWLPQCEVIVQGG